MRVTTLHSLAAGSIFVGGVGQRSSGTKDDHQLIGRNDQVHFHVVHLAMQLSDANASENSFGASPCRDSKSTARKSSSAGPGQQPQSPCSPGRPPFACLPYSSIPATKRMWLVTVRRISEMAFHEEALD